VNLLLKEKTSVIKEEIIAGIKDQLPLSLGVIPYGLVFGAYAVSLGFTALESIASSLLINAGSSQVAALSLLVGGASPFIVLFSITLINIRFMLYSATLAVHMHELKKSWRILFSYWLTDASFLLILKKYQERSSPDNVWYSTGIAFGQWFFWEISCIFGVILGPLIPTELRLDFALPLIFISLLSGHMESSSMVVASIISGILAVLFINTPNNLGLIISIVVGIASGLCVEEIQSKHNCRIAS